MAREAPQAVANAHSRPDFKTLPGDHGWRRLPDLLILRSVISGAILGLAGLAHLSGAPAYLSLAIFLVGVASLALATRSIQIDMRRNDRIQEAALRSRETIESLSDRMWELQESEERFRGLSDALGDLVIHRDRAGRLVYANRVFADIVGLDHRDLVGRTLAELGVDLGVVPDAAFASGEYLNSTDLEIQTANGARWFSWIELSVRDKESLAASHRAIARDITARKMAEAALIEAREKAEHANLAKTRFLATVSHEIRTPMNGIAGMAKLLADTRLSSEQRTYVSAIATSSSALIALIEDLLDFSKIESGRFEAEVQPASPRMIADSVVELLSLRAYERGIGLGCHVAPDVPRLIDTDPNRLRQVLVNLIGNAIKFTASGGVSLSVERAKVNDLEVLRFAVADSGAGIAESDRERVFDEFEQVDASSTRNHGGLGLGLAISRGLVKSMGGSIQVDHGKDGLGSVFSFIIPVRGAVEEDPARFVDLSGRSYLIVSDNNAEAVTLEMTLSAHGAVVARSRSPGDTGPLAATFDAVLVDAVFAEKSSHIGVGSPDLRAAVLIAPSDRERLPRFRAMGYDTFLARPVRSDTLVRILRSQPALAETGANDAPESGGPAPATESRLRILIAEDNEINALLARTTLAKAGHSVDVVNDGKAAVEAITGRSGQSAAHDIILMDLHMPVLDGLDAILEIRAHETRTNGAPVPILVLSADGQEKTRQEALVAGANGFIAKPLDPAKLLRVVEAQVALA